MHFRSTSLLSYRAFTYFAAYGGVTLLGGGHARMAFAQPADVGVAPAPALQAAPPTGAPTPSPTIPVPAVPPANVSAAPVLPGDVTPAAEVTVPPPASAPAPSAPDGALNTTEPSPVTAALTPASAQPPEEAAAHAFDITGAPGQGLTVSTGDAFSLNIKSRIQVRYQAAVFDDPNKDAQQLVNIGTARIWLGGHVYVPQLTYQIQLAVAGKDYRDGATSPIFDAYLEWRAHRDFSVRAGQYFVPFDRLRTVREWGLQLAERPRPVQEFTLDRDVGVTFFSEKFLGDHSPVAWYLSAFGGHGTNQVNPSAVGGLFTGRVELRPLGPIDDDREGDLDRREKPGLALGVGAAHNYKSSRVRSTTGPTFVGGTTNDTYVAADLTFKWMGFALQGEYLYKDTSALSFESDLGDGETLTEYTHEGGGWVAQASYAFDPPFEVVARLSRLYYGSTIEPAFINDVNRRGNELAGGLNYYFNGHRMKAQATWVGRTNADLALGKADHLAVVQIDATF